MRFSAVAGPGAAPGLTIPAMMRAASVATSSGVSTRPMLETTVPGFRETSSTSAKKSSENSGSARGWSSEPKRAAEPIS